jgi:hypothetical protein
MVAMVVMNDSSWPPISMRRGRTALVWSWGWRGPATPVIVG